MGDLAAELAEAVALLGAAVDALRGEGDRLDGLGDDLWRGAVVRGEDSLARRDRGLEVRGQGVLVSSAVDHRAGEALEGVQVGAGGGINEVEGGEGVPQSPLGTSVR